MSPRTGRPVSENGKKSKLLQIRVDELTLKQLDNCAEQLKSTRSDVVREGIKLVSDKLMRKK